MGNNTKPGTNGSGQLLDESMLRRLEIMTAALEPRSAVAVVIGAIENPQSLYTETIALPAAWTPQDWRQLAAKIRDWVSELNSGQAAND